MTRMICTTKGKTYGAAGWCVNRQQYINTVVFELHCTRDGNTIAAFHTVEEMSGFARMLHEDMDLRGGDMDRKTKEQYTSIVSAIGDAVREESTRQSLEIMAEVEARNDKRVKEWEEKRRGRRRKD
jgi:hypothetical protein